MILVKEVIIYSKPKARKESQRREKGKWKWKLYYNESITKLEGERDLITEIR